MKLATLAVVLFFAAVTFASLLALAVLEEADGHDDAWDEALADLIDEEAR